MIRMLAGNHAAAVSAKTAPASLKRLPQAPFVPTIAATPPTVQLFCLRPVKWKDAKGKQITAQKFTDVELTPSAAMFALSENACVQINDPLRRQHHGTYPGNADPALAFDLDKMMSAPKSAAASAPLSSMFTVVDRGPGTTIKHREPNAMFGDVR